MAKYKQTDAEYGQGQFLEVNLYKQLIPGTYEYMINDLIGGKIDTNKFDEKYKNDKTGASAINPRSILKLISYGYKKGCKSSRALEDLNNNNMIAKALTKDTAMHWTTIADFISGNSEDIKEVFTKVLMNCNELGLIGGEMFAIDGLRLPSNAALSMSGTKEELEKHLEVIKKMAGKHIERNKERDAASENDKERERKYERRQKDLRNQIEKISGFLEKMEKKEGKRGTEIRSNVTDNESAMIMSGKEYIQGYIGMAFTDAKKQVIVAAEAYGSANESEHFEEMLEEVKENMEAAGVEVKKEAVILADNNYWGEENLQAAKDKGFEALIPDGEYKTRRGGIVRQYYGIEDFKYNKRSDSYRCPFGKKLIFRRMHSISGRAGREYELTRGECINCPYNSKCIRSRNNDGSIKRGRKLFVTKSGEEGSLCRKTKAKMSEEKYQAIYAYRIGIIEPVFSDIGYCKGLDRIMVRGRRKANRQWLLYCMVHNLGKCLNEYNKRRGYA
jgi:transposase